MTDQVEESFKQLVQEFFLKAVHAVLQARVEGLEGE
eukprot:CAMPEP_0119130332 /NCGR_PEP_ID=MMETSP1310-20130426/7714_1 /TAXON_ID=464262 /ORGANISM="Genus nov. species nov., Strain RCC2339" /LENGTH=35 /DNA_ID= /DNA_START= /DNA_END= /DNA_ORIENTATION=